MEQRCGEYAGNQRNYKQHAVTRVKSSYGTAAAT